MRSKMILNGLLVLILMFSPSAFAEDSAKARVTILVASNQGNDFNLDNDAFRDQLIKLFSYSSYHQVTAQAVELKSAQPSTLSLPDGYDLSLEIQGFEENRVLIHAVINKEGKSYVDTVLSAPKEGVAFLGGPQVSGGDLVIVLEMSF